MSPLLDQLAVGAIIAAALAFFYVRIFTRRSSGKGCGSGCCTPKKPVIDRRPGVSSSAASRKS